MADVPLKQRFAALCQITRAQHFLWRQAVREVCPGVDPSAVVSRMWEVTGRDTAGAYLKRVDRAKPLAAQIAASIAWSSRCMGEEARAEPGRDAGEAFVRHRACPWLEWHRAQGLLEEDQPGCDRWFQSVVAEINRALGTEVRVETLEALPSGGSCCLRRFWEGGASRKPASAGKEEE
ncbi:MAG: hypothetical protein HY719_06590 [Planctomycetes bacterium]|nr:hypothetical protein [Planctomycetota bacterium]